MQYLSFCVWLISHSIMFSRFICIVRNGKIFFLFLRLNNVLSYVCTTYSLATCWFTLHYIYITLHYIYIRVIKENSFHVLNLIESDPSLIFYLVLSYIFLNSHYSYHRHKKGHTETFEGNGYICYLGDGFMNVSTSKPIKLYMLDMCSICISITPQ